MTSSRIIRGPVAAFTSPLPPIIGKIKVGLVVDGHPASTDYFVCSSKYEPLFRRAYGDKPTSLEIAFPSNDISQVAHEELVVRDKGGRLLSSGNGEVWRSWSMKNEVYVDDDRATTDEIQKRYGQPAKPTMTLRFVLSRMADVMGTFTFTTRGDLTSIPALRNVVDYMLEKFGAISHIPFDLQVKKVKSNSPGSKSAYPVVSLIANVSEESLELMSAYIAGGGKVRGILTGEKIKMLTATAEVIPEARLLPAAAADAQEK